MRILYNAKIRTLDPDLPEASAIAVDHGRIIALGGDDDVLNLADFNVVREDMGGATLWPGLTDAHLHLSYYSQGLSKVNCETSTKAECLRRVAERAAADPQSDWILGHGWNQNEWPEGFGSADELEAVAPGRPVYLTAKSLHAAWANRTALQRAGLTAASPDPEGGLLQRDARGELTGILMESAMELVGDILPSPSVPELADRIAAAQETLWRLGLTGVHDFDGRDCFSALQLLDTTGRLKLRVTKSIPLENLPAAVQVGLRTGFGSDYLRIGSVKLFADGALGPQTAAMIQPYTGSVDNTGVLLLDAEEIFEHGQQAVRAGISMAIHSIGDRANHEVLAGYRHLRNFERQNGLPRLRHRIEHVQVLHPDDRLSLAELDVIASMQPIHTTSDMYTADRYWGERSALAYAFRTLRDSGTRLTFGSDAPVESPNPFWGLHAAVTRRRVNGEPGPEGWYPEQRLSLQAALEAYTIGPAYAAQQEERLGRLCPGMVADLIALPVDPFAMPPHELATLLPIATMVAGEWVWVL
jgi:predicted amidohydrolase YtcJ